MVMQAADGGGGSHLAHGPSWFSFRPLLLGSFFPAVEETQSFIIGGTLDAKCWVRKSFGRVRKLRREEKDVTLLPTMLLVDCDNGSINDSL